MGPKLAVDHDLDVPNRIHIIPMGFEEERVVRPLEEFGADRAIVISHEENKQDGKFSEHYSEVADRLERLGIRFEHRECYIFDVYDSIRAIGKVISGSGGDDVYVNLSAGSKITAIAGMIVCMSSTGTPYYARADDYSGDVPRDVREISSLPQLRIDPPSADEIAILGHLADDGPSTKGELIEFGEEEGLNFLSGFNGKEKARYRRLDRHVVSSLRESGYVNVNRDGRKMVVAISESGQKAFRAFSYLNTQREANRQGSQQMLHGFQSAANEK